MNRDKMKEILEMAQEAFPEGEEGMRGGNCVSSECCCPRLIIYLIETECLTINNAGCPDWTFCQNGLLNT